MIVFFPRAKRMALGIFCLLNAKMPKNSIIFDIWGIWWYNDYMCLILNDINFCTFHTGRN